MERRRTDVVRGFTAWLTEKDPDASGDAQYIGRTVRLLLDLKTTYLDSPDPVEWSEDLIADLLIEVVPRRVTQRREESMELGPTMHHLIDYLVDADRWPSSGYSADDAHALLDELEFDVLEAANDPTRRSFSGNILAYAADLGVDFGEPGMTDRYMAWYNSLTVDERHELTDTGTLRNPGTPFDPTGEYPEAVDARGPIGSSAFGEGLDALGGDDGDAESSLADHWPAFLGDPPDSDGDDTPFDPQDLQNQYREVTFVHRALLLYRAAADGLGVTETGALNRAATASILEKFGIDASATGSMWDISAITGPWLALLSGEWLRIEGKRVVATDEGIVPPMGPDEDPEGFAEFANSVMARLLLNLYVDAGEPGGLQGLPYTPLALSAASGEGGLVPVRPVLPGRGGDFDEFVQYTRVMEDLGLLVGYGLLDYDPLEHRFSAPTVVLLAMATVLDIAMQNDL